MPCSLDNRELKFGSIRLGLHSMGCVMQKKEVGDGERKSGRSYIVAFQQQLYCLDGISQNLRCALLRIPQVRQFRARWINRHAFPVCQPPIAATLPYNQVIIPDPRIRRKERPARNDMESVKPVDDGLEARVLRQQCDYQPKSHYRIKQDRDQ